MKRTITKTMIKEIFKAARFRVSSRIEKGMVLYKIEIKPSLFSRWVPYVYKEYTIEELENVFQEYILYEQDFSVTFVK